MYRPGKSRFESPTSTIIDRTQQKLSSEAEELARHVYAERPRAWRRRMRSYWRAGRVSRGADGEPRLKRCYGRGGLGGPLVYLCNAGRGQFCRPGASVGNALLTLSSDSRITWVLSPAIHRRSICQ